MNEHPELDAEFAIVELESRRAAAPDAMGSGGSGSSGSGSSASGGSGSGGTATIIGTIIPSSSSGSGGGSGT